MPKFLGDVDEIIKGARRSALTPPAVWDPDGKGLRPLVGSEWAVERLKYQNRAEQYARWRIAAYEAGEVASPY